MVRANHGWNVIMFLMVMTIMVLLANNCFNIATHLFMTARMRHRHHQEARLLEGLLKYGIQVCNENKELLLRWGSQESQTMYLEFNSWPAELMRPLFGNHAGLLAITSEKGVLHIKAQLIKDTRLSMAGSCDLRPVSMKNPRGRIYISHWAVHK